MYVTNVVYPTSLFWHVSNFKFIHLKWKSASHSMKSKGYWAWKAQINESITRRIRILGRTYIFSLISVLSSEMQFFLSLTFGEPKMKTQQEIKVWLFALENILHSERIQDSKEFKMLIFNFSSFYQWVLLLTKQNV